MLNKITLIGHLGRDPQLDYTEAGTAVGEFTLAVNHYSKSSDGERKEETDWFNVVHPGRELRSVPHQGGAGLRRGSTDPGDLYRQDRRQAAARQGAGERCEVPHTESELTGRVTERREVGPSCCSASV